MTDSILIVAEHSGGTLNASTAKCIACARDIGAASIDVIVAGSDVAAVAGEAATLDGVSGVLTIERSENEHALAAVLAPQIVAVAGDYSHVLGPSTTFGKDLMPRVAALLDVGQVTDIMQVVGPRSFKRPIYAGNAIITVDVDAASKVVATVRTASYKAVAAGDGTADIRAVDVDVALPSHTRFVGVEGSSSDRPDLQTAAKVVSGGRALGSSENFDIIYGLAEKLGAAVGASRAAVDAGYVPNDMQVGQTGKIIAPDLYIAIGISGAIQHLTGIKDAGTIVAINKDEDAPIFEIADIGLVGDLFSIVPELSDALS
ncbi:MAG: FAD-binding protein [Pseudomonadota bacterium]